MTKVVVRDYDHKDVEIYRKVFEAAGYDFQWLNSKTVEKVIDSFQGDRVFLNMHAPMNEKVIKDLPH